MRYHSTQMEARTQSAVSYPTCMGSGLNNPVSTVTAFRAKREAAASKYDTTQRDAYFSFIRDAAFGEPTCEHTEETALSVLPGDVTVEANVSILPGDQFLKTARERAFKVFGSMREAFAVPAAA